MTRPSSPRPPASAPNVEALYGLHSVRAALCNPRRRLVGIQTTRNAHARLAAELAKHGIEAQIVPPEALDRIAGPDAVHQGVVAEFEALRQPRLDQIPRQGILVLLDQVSDPHNVGAILRSCAAFAASALVMTARHSPDGSAALAKAASGALEHVPMVKVTNLARAMREIKDYGFTVIGLDGDAPTEIADLRPEPPIALVLGAEGKGLRELTRKTCDLLARISLPGPIASLNVSNAAALALYALARRF